MKPLRLETIDGAISALMDALAQVLLQLEITPARLTQISRTSFVRVAASQARKRSSGRPHLAKIAAITGLTRVEVKRIVDRNFSLEKSRADSGPRALKVLAAWRSARGYSHAGKPRQLAITGPAPSFAALCRAHSGDIPYQVVLGELQKTGRVKTDSRRNRIAIAPSRTKRVSAAKAGHALRFAASLLAAALQEDLLLVRRKQRVYASSAVPRTYLEQAISERINELLDNMPAQFPKPRRRVRDSVNVFALVSRSRAPGLMKEKK